MGWSWTFDLGVSLSSSWSLSRDGVRCDRDLNDSALTWGSSYSPAKQKTLALQTGIRAGFG